MKFWKLASAVSALVISTNVNAVLIDFEEFELTAMNNFVGSLIPTSARISNQYLGTDGVIFSSGNDFIAAVNLGIGHATSGSVGIGGSDGANGLTYAGEFFRANFFDPNNISTQAVTNYVEIRGDNISDGTGGTFSAYDINGVLLGSDSQTNVSGNTFVLAFEGIHSVKFTGSGTIALDDLTFNPVTAIPVPAAVWLFASGLLGLIGVARRKKS
jgi:hypothetical protein